MRNSLYILLGLSSTQVDAQSYLMSSSNDGEVITTCSGIFLDDGGTTNDYSSSIEDRTLTICSANPSEILIVDFISFNIEANYDNLEVFNGTSTAGVPVEILTGNIGAFTIYGAMPGDCLTFRFNSDLTIQKEGWEANISCALPCTPPIASLTDDSTLDICSGDPADLTVSLDASTSYSTDNNGISGYIWDWGDGTTTETITPITTHTYADEPGIYNINLSVKTDNFSLNPEGCFSTNFESKKIRITPPPIFEGSSTTPITIDCGASVDLMGIASSQTITSTPPIGTGTNTALPDSTDTPFESTIDFSGFFPVGASVSSHCLPKITLNLEHSYAGDLEIILIAPSGEEIFLFQGFGNPNISGLFFGYCVNEGTGTGPGCPAPYHVVNSGGLEWDNAASLTTFNTTCSEYGGPCQNGDYYIQDAEFNSVDPLTNLIGADLNGIWTLRIIDNLTIDDGHLESWSLSFPSDCYDDIEVLTPILSDGVWSHSGSGPTVSTTQNITNTPYTTIGIDPCPAGETCIGNQIINNTTVGPFEAAGTFTYTFTTTDNFGCNYSYDVDIIVEEIIITFDDITNSYCQNEENIDELPSISSNNIIGTWSPEEIDTTVVGETTYTFTPTTLGCATPYDLIVTIVSLPETSEIIFIE